MKVKIEDQADRFAIKINDGFAEIDVNKAAGFKAGAEWMLGDISMNRP